MPSRDTTRQLIGTILAVFFLYGCSERQELLATLPLYESCQPFIDEYGVLMHEVHYNVTFEQELYHPVVPQLPGLIGNVRVYGELEDEDLETVLNGFRECLPQPSLRMKLKDLASLPSSLKESRAWAKEQYILIENETITVVQRIQVDE